MSDCRPVSKGQDQYSLSMVAELGSNLRKSGDDAPAEETNAIVGENRCQQIEARLSVVHSHHQLVHKSFAARIEYFEKEAEEKTRANR